MTKEFKLSTAKLKKAGKELQVILEPTEDDGVTPLIIADGTDDEMKTKIIEGGNALTTDDSISAHLTKVLEALNVTVSDEEEINEKDTVTEPIEVILTWNDINAMKKKELKKLCEEKKLVTESDDYEKIKDFRIDVAVELGIEVPKEKVKEENLDGGITDDKGEEVKEEPKEKIEVTLDLVEIVNDTKKLADLKEIVDSNDEFKKLRKGLKEYKGLSGPRKLKPKMLELLGVEVESSDKEVKKPVKEPAKESGKEKAKSKSEKKREDVQKESKLKASSTNKSRYGRSINSMVGIMDELLYKGTTESKLVQAVQKVFPDKTEKVVQSRIKEYTNTLKKNGFDLVIDGKKYKCTNQTSPK